MSLLTSFRPLLRLCQIFGITPLTQIQGTLVWKSHFTLRILSIIHIVFKIIPFFSALVLIDELSGYEQNPIRKALFVLISIINGLRGIVLQIELFINRDQQVKVLNQFERLNRLLENRFNTQVDFIKLHRTCRIFILVGISQLLIRLVVYLRTRRLADLEHFILFFPSFMVGIVGQIYSVFLMYLVQTYYDTTSKYLKSTIKEHGYYMRDTFLDRNDFKQNTSPRGNEIFINLDKLQEISCVFSTLWDSSRQINAMTYFSSPIAMLQNTLLLIVNCWLLFIFLVSTHTHILNVLTSIIFTLSLITNMIFIAHISSKTVRSVSG